MDEPKLEGMLVFVISFGVEVSETRGDMSVYGPGP